jgi:HAD superfamily hydrolase (TIGR01509 family)
MNEVRAMGTATGRAVHPVELVIFDCDGVLVDSEPISFDCLQRAWARIGADIAMADLRRRFLGISARRMVEIGARDFGVTPPASFLDDLRTDILAAYEGHLAPIPGVPEVVRALTVPCCVASSSDSIRLRRTLEIAGLLPLFGARIFSADQVMRGKPFPDLPLFAAAQCGVPPEGCVVVEDSIAGVEAALAAGMRAVGFIGGGHLDDGSGAALRAAGASLVVASFAELPGILAALSEG